MFESHQYMQILPAIVNPHDRKESHLHMAQGFINGRIFSISIGWSLCA